MKAAIALVLALLLFVPAYLIHIALKAWEWWHFGPSQSILRGLRWMNYKAFKPLANWIEKETRNLPWRRS